MLSKTILSHRVNRLRKKPVFSFCIFAFIVFMASALMAKASFSQTPVDYGTCVSIKKQQDEATAACATKICKWQECKNQIIYRTGSSGTRSDALTSYKKDPGAWGSALAVCKPHETIMTECLRDNSITKSQEKKVDKPTVFCRTGSDKDLANIGAKIYRMRDQLLKYKAALKPLRQRHKDHLEAINEVSKVLDPLRASFNADKARAQANDDFVETYRSRWIYSGKIDVANELNNKRNQQFDYLKEVKSELIPMQKKYTTLSKRYKYIASDLMDKKRDCAAAKEALGL